MKHSYRADIDGLRAVAVIAVIFFHAFPDRIPGGFVGVDVFFVISGFLITGIIHRNLKNGDFSFADFWARRIRRIFPSLLTIAVAVYVAGWFYLLPTEFEALKKHIKWGLSFAANFKLSSEVGYFDTAAELKPLLHLWSLAIEEQFYFVWPVMLWICHRFKINLFGVTFLLALVSFGCRRLFPHSASEAFYFPWTRFWELQAGAMLAIGSERPMAVFERWREPFRAWGGMIGLAFIGYACLMFNRETTFPSKFTFIPVIGSCLIIMAGDQCWFNRRVLSQRLLVFIGLISFPLYLWHWPILSFIRIIQIKPAAGTLWIALLVSVLLAIATYHGIEGFMRFEKGKFKWRTVTLLGSSSCALLFLNVVSIHAKSTELGIAKIDAAINNWAYPGPTMKAQSLGSGLSYYEIKTQIPRYVLYIGDSHMEQYGPRIEKISEENPGETLSSMWITRWGCLLVEGFGPHCIDTRLKLVELIKNREKYGIERIVWTHYWSGYLEGSIYDSWDKSGKKLVGAEKLNARIDAIRQFIAFLRDSGADITVLSDVPMGSSFDPVTMVSRKINGNFVISPPLTDRSELVKSNGMALEILRQQAASLGVHFLDPMDHFCSTTSCPVRDFQNRPLYKDSNHFAAYAARDFLGIIDETVLAKRSGERYTIRKKF